MCERQRAVRCGVLVLLLAGWMLGSSAGDERPAAGKTARVPVAPKDTLPATIDLEAIPRGIGMPRAVPRDNPLTQQRVDLGRKLFFDTRLSGDRTVSCASCHQPEHGFASPDPRAIGIRGQVGRRNAPTLLNRAFGKSQFWDGRAASLEAQSLQPIANPKELGHSIEGVVAELRQDASYLKLFHAAFAERSQGDATSEAASYVTSENLARSLAAFQRTLLVGDSPVDRFQEGTYQALTDSERQGLWIFESRGRCWKCHTGDNYSDEKFHNTGIGLGREDPDLGRFEVSGNAADKGKFKTPTLRAIGRTAPYMHDGSLKTLKEVVDFYNRGGESSDAGLDPEIRPLGLSDEEVLQLVAFLQALSRESK